VPRYGGNLHVELPLLPATLDPLRMAGDAGALVASCIYEGLTTWGERAPSPGLAEQWVRGDGGSRWLFHLRGGLVFHDGMPCDARSVSESLHRLADPRWSSHAWILEDLVGRDDFVSGRTLRIEGIYVHSPREIELVFARPVPDLAERLALPAAAIARRNGAVPAGTGPFRVADAAEASIRLVAFDGHRAGRPFLDGIWFSAAADAGGAVPDGAVRLRRLEPRDPVPQGRQRLRVPARRLALAVIHPQSAALAAPGARQLLADTFDSELFVRTYLGGDGEPAAGLAPGSAAALARQAAGQEGARAPWPQRLRLLGVTGEPVLRLLGERLVEKLVALGVEATHDVLPPAQFAAALQAASYDVVLLGWTPPQPEEALPEATRARVIVSALLQPLFGERLASLWRDERGEAAGEAALLGSSLVPLLFFHEAWDVSEALTDIHSSGLAADLGLAGAHLEPSP
jgi:MarR-like DNA-binding transcriptional regulator SgrR of sgrS sRNA